MGTKIINTKCTADKRFLSPQNYLFQTAICIVITRYCKLKELISKKPYDTYFI